MFQHLFGDVPSDIADGLVPCAAFGKIRDQRVPVVVPTAGHAGFLPHVVPGRLQSDHWPGRILRPRFSKWKNVPFRSNRSEPLGVPLRVLHQRCGQSRVQGRAVPFAVAQLNPTVLRTNTQLRWVGSFNFFRLLVLGTG